MFMLFMRELLLDEAFLAHAWGEHVAQPGCKSLVVKAFQHMEVDVWFVLS
jgi:hypothetical protein